MPLGARAILPFDPSVIVIVLEFDPELVSKTKSCAPLVVKVAAANPLYSQDPAFRQDVEARLSVSRDLL